MGEGSKMRLTSGPGGTEFSAGGEELRHQMGLYSTHQNRVPGLITEYMKRFGGERPPVLEITEEPEVQSARQVLHDQAADEGRLS